jgi:hypothetical protein
MEMSEAKAWHSSRSRRRSISWDTIRFRKGRRSSVGAGPLVAGAFVAFALGQMTALTPEIARSEDRLHFAGEHTSSWMGWMEGALDSGERAAARDSRMITILLSCTDCSRSPCSGRLRTGVERGGGRHSVRAPIVLREIPERQRPPMRGRSS